MKKTLMTGILSTACLLVVPAPAWADSGPANEGTITVSGSAALQVQADLATLSFGVQTEAADASSALAANTRLMNEVIDAIRQVGMEEGEISTAQFNIGPVYERQQDRASGIYTQVLRGYRVSNVLNVETEHLEKVASVIDAAVLAGSNRVDRIDFGLSRALREDSRKQLIEAAMNDAREKAAMALAPLDYAIVGVKNVSVADHAQPGPMYAENVRMDMAVASAPPVMAGDQSVTTMVHVTFLIGAK